MKALIVAVPPGASSGRSAANCDRRTSAVTVACGAVESASGRVTEPPSGSDALVATAALRTTAVQGTARGPATRCVVCSTQPWSPASGSGRFRKSRAYSTEVAPAIGAAGTLVLRRAPVEISVSPSPVAQGSRFDSENVTSVLWVARGRVGRPTRSVPRSMCRDDSG
ncbi:hypothetical protein [Anaeromyxobacter oryzae]|uniref:hypothetical protein n=1 Tax=Anaeromyxobacter oryzae TaxID=2918170 RepID=UPI00384EC4B5